MLKNQSRSYQDRSTQDRYERKPKGSRMDDEKVAKYIKVFFDHSPRAASGSAPAAEWLEFLKLFNKSDEDYMLSESERKAVLPYCQQNPELEMTPEEFTSLLHLVRHAEEKFDTPITPLHAARTSTKPDTPHVRASYNRARNVMDSRPRSSKILNTNRSYSYYDDRTSINHPDSNSTHNMEEVTRSAYMIERDNEYDKLKRESMLLRKQLRDYDSRMSSISKEHAERTARLEEQLDNLRAELRNQKATMAEYTNREREKISKINELKTIVHNFEIKNEAAIKKIQKKDDEIEDLKEKLAVSEEENARLENFLGSVETERQQLLDAESDHRKNFIDLQKKMDQERVARDGEKDNLERELEEQRRKVAKLEEVIDKQKFDLDEARSGLRAYSNTPILTLENDPENASLAQEELETKYGKEIQRLKDECEELKDRNKQLENAQEKHLDNIDQLVSKVNEEFIVVDNIESRVSHTFKNMRRSWFFILSIILWTVFVYLITPIISHTQPKNCHSGPSPDFLDFVADFF